MTHINAQNVKCVNAYSGTPVGQIRPMGKKSEAVQSEFWERLTAAWSLQGLPTSQNGVATTLDMSQGSTRRWYTGDGYPETEVLRTIADKGHVTIDWLLEGRLPRTPISEHSPLGKLIMIWEQLDQAGRDHLYQTALGQLALKPPQTSKIRKIGA